MFAQIFQHIKSSDKIIITRHIRPDPDAYCSQAALASSLKATFPDKKIFAVGDIGANIKELYDMDKIKDEAFQDALIIVLDTANKARVAEPRFEKGKLVIKIDHHPETNDEYGDIRWVEDKTSSTCEMVWKLIRNTELIANDDIAKLIYMGIWADTGRFLYPNTNGDTFTAAADIVNNFNVDLVEVSEWFSNLKLDVLKLKGHLLEYHNFDSGVAWVVINQEMMKKYKVKIGDIGQIVSLFAECVDVRIWLVASQEESGDYRINIRAKKIKINHVAEKYNGGGHMYASGAKLKNIDEIKKIVNDLKHELVIQTKQD